MISTTTQIMGWSGLVATIGWIIVSKSTTKVRYYQFNQSIVNNMYGYHGAMKTSHGKNRNRSQVDLIGKQIKVEALSKWYTASPSEDLDQAQKRIKIETIQVKRLKRRRRQMELQKQLKQQQENDKFNELQTNRKSEQINKQRLLISKAIGEFMIHYFLS
jgi:hypothetical protein